MKTKAFLACLLVAGFVALPFGDAHGQDRRGTAGAQHLLLPLTAQSASLGTSFTSGLVTASGLEGVDSNPAILTVNDGTNALFSRLDYVADIGVNYFGVAQNFGANNVALTISAWDFGDIPLQTEESPEISDVTWDATFVTVGLAYARQFTDRISAGVNFKVVSERIDDVSSSGLVFDAGMVYDVGESGLRFGVSLKNFGFERAYDGTGLTRQTKLGEQNPDAQPTAVQLDGAEYELPSLLNFGIAYTRQLSAETDVTALANFRSNSFTENQFAGALELSVFNIVALRGGYQFQDDMDSNDFLGWTIGGGVNLDLQGNVLSVDYAYMPMDRLGDLQLITAAITL